MFSVLLHAHVEPRGSVAARRIPADCRAKLSVSNPSHPHQRVAERRKSRAGTPTRWSALRQDPSLLREGTAGPSRGPARLAAPHCGVFLRPRDRLLKRTVTTSDHNHPAGISTCVHPLHQPVAGRPHVVGARLPKPPEAWLTRPNPQAPPLLRQQAP